MSEAPAIRVAKGSTYLVTTRFIVVLINVFAFAFIATLLTMERAHQKIQQAKGKNK